jgi:hypothetical protein
MWKHLRSAAFGVALWAAAAPTTAVAEPVSPAARSDDADTDDGASEHQRIDRRIQDLRAERDDISRGPPIVLISLGGAIGTFALMGAGMTGMLAGTGHINSDAQMTPKSTYYIVSGIGFAAALGGIVWLVDCNRQRAELTHRIEQLERRRRSSVAILPILEPVTGRAGIEVQAVF